MAVVGACIGKVKTSIIEPILSEILREREASIQVEASCG
jgi:hypothetical protein